MTLLDLGRAGGTILLQAALEFGCEALSVEIWADIVRPYMCSTLTVMDPLLLLTSFIGNKYLMEGSHHLQGCLGSVTALHGNFLTDSQATDWILTAAVILINNQAFFDER